MIDRSVFALCFVLLIGTSTLADDRPAGSWPGWRGPLRNGMSTETGLLTEWTDEGPPLVWKATGLGEGYSSVAISRGTIYTMGFRRGKGDLIALSESDGREKWSVPIGGSKPHSTPTLDGNHVFAIGLAGDLVCVEADSGQEVWRKSLLKAFDGKTERQGGYSESLLIDGDRIICTPGTREIVLAALHRKTGDVLWKTKVPERKPAPDEKEPPNQPKQKDHSGYSSVVVSTACGVRQYVQLTGWGVISVRAEDGTPLWVYERAANELANITTPVVRGNYVFCSSAYETGAALLELKPNGGGVRAEEVYFLDHKTLQNHHGGLVLIGDHIYGGHGHNNGFPLCVEFATGKVAWRPGRGPGTGSAAVVYADGHLYFRYENGVVALIEATPEAYALKGSFTPPSTIDKAWAHPVVAGGRLYLRDDDVLMCYEIKK